ncbi:uncharacterized protein LOC21388157 isoform X2 [Morus notabilis]|uniref:uncharacterized protein LOC21388157 isoform X2 n=1 Tax=Morus notabilis TaxID=981085 RepID=UPI000CED023D|nr:uncharacterized protein LOC21388157 isoform X2 [Morus notabilis]
MNEKKRPKAVIVGGSIAGVSCAHSLILAGWDVAVLEKSCAPPTGSPTGAGLGLDPLARTLIGTWIKSHQLLHNTTLPLTFDQNQATDGEKKVSWTVTRDEKFNFRAAYWADLHDLLYNALPPNIFLWGHLFSSFSVCNDKKAVKVKAKVLQTEEIVDVVGDLLVAADGCLSSIRRSFLPDLKLRYAGYCAWRGVLDFSENENSDTIRKNLNWIWYINQPEPELKKNSVTMKVTDDMIQKMHQEAEKIWDPALARVIKETKEPFINVIYDSDPLQQLYWDNVVLVGDAAHPTTPHGLRSTNMSLLDAAVLGACLDKWGREKLESALEEYQSIRLPVVAKQALHSRRMGRLKQGLVLETGKTFDLKTANSEDCEELQQKNMPYFADAPLPVGSRYACSTP